MTNEELQLPDSGRFSLVILVGVGAAEYCGLYPQCIECVGMGILLGVGRPERH